MFSDGTTFNSKVKAYQNALDLILQCIPIIEILCERNNSTKDRPEETVEDEAEDSIAAREEAAEEERLKDEEEKLVVLLEQRVQFILRSLTKLFLNKNPGCNKKEYVIFPKSIYT